MTQNKLAMKKSEAKRDSSTESVLPDMIPRFVAPTISAEMITTKELSPKAEYGYKKRFVRGDQAGLSPALRNI